jgi:cytochrome c oxidase subunit II
VDHGLIWFDQRRKQPGFFGTALGREHAAQSRNRIQNMTMRLLTMLRTTTFALGLMAGGAFAQGLEIVGQPIDGGTGFQPAVTELARDIEWLDNFINVIIAVITVFVTALLIWCVVRFNARRNPKPATFTHNSPVEVAWTLVPILILVVIGAFSLPVLFKQLTIPVAEVTIKATGNQWNWTYDYVDELVDPVAGDGSTLVFDSFMIGAPATGGANMLTPEVEAQLTAAGYGREQFLLATDTAMVVPVGKTVVMQITGSDVIHAWAMPAFGVMQSGVPGRISQLWFTAEREGIYFGQCTTLCGQMHAYMPITVKVVSEEVYVQWLAANKAALAADSVLDRENFVQPETFIVAGTGVPLTVAAND